jgi:hypothetical protein
MKNSIKKNRSRSNLGTRFLSSNGLGFGDFWSRKDNFKIPKDLFSLNGLYFHEESAIICRFSSYFFARLNMCLPDSLLKSPRGPGLSFYWTFYWPTKPDLNVSKLFRAFKMLNKAQFCIIWFVKSGPRGAWRASFELRIVRTWGTRPYMVVNMKNEKNCQVLWMKLFFVSENREKSSFSSIFWTFKLRALLSAPRISKNRKKTIHRNLYIGYPFFITKFRHLSSHTNFTSLLRSVPVAGQWTHTVFFCTKLSVPFRQRSWFYIDYGWVSLTQLLNFLL